MQLSLENFGDAIKPYESFEVRNSCWLLEQLEHDCSRKGCWHWLVLVPSEIQWESFCEKANKSRFGIRDAVSVIDNSLHRFGDGMPIIYRLAIGNLQVYYGKMYANRLDIAATSFRWYANHGYDDAKIVWLRENEPCGISELFKEM